MLTFSLSLNSSINNWRLATDEQVIILDDLQGTVMSRLTANEVELTELEPELLGLQEELQE